MCYSHKLLSARISEIDAAIADLLALRKALVGSHQAAVTSTQTRAAICLIIEERWR